MYNDGKDYFRESLNRGLQKVEGIFPDRVCALGGDCACIEGNSGALESTKWCIGMALESSIQDHLLPPKDVEDVIKNIFYNNPRQFFKFK